MASSYDQGEPPFVFLKVNGCIHRLGFQKSQDFEFKARLEKQDAEFKAHLMHSHEKGVKK